MAELKTKENNGDVQGFLHAIEDEQRKADCLQLLELFEKVTGEPPKMWGETMVGFGRYHYKYASGREGDWFLVGFSPRKQNLTIYLTIGFTSFDDLMKDLGKYKTGKSCLYVNRLSDIDEEKLKNLVKRSVEVMQQRYET